MPQNYSRRKQNQTFYDIVKSCINVIFFKTVVEVFGE